MTVTNESATDVLVARAQRRESLTPMVVVSIIGHAIVFGGLAFMSLSAASPPPPKVFVVSFTGGPGPRTGGANPMGGRPIERVAPPEPPKVVERPPDAKPPKMVLPEPERKPQPPRETSRTTVENARPAPPTTGAEVRPGTTRMDTGAKGPGFGLSTGGGGSSSPIQTDVTDFCCPDYLQDVSDRIRAVWKPEQGRAGITIVSFTIRRDGSVSSIGVAQQSGVPNFDFAAQRAVQLAILPRLPAQFPGEALGIRLTFNNER